ncbi:MAG: lysophospholipid acyltransferase family protein [Pyrinomonadaceae bacterium]
MQKKINLQTRLEYAAVRSILGALGVLPRAAAISIGIAFAGVMYSILGGLRKTGVRNLEIAFPEIENRERLRIVKGSFRSLGRVLGEMSQFHKTTPASLEKIIEFDIDPQILKAYEKIKHEGRGAIITTGHIGNWELFVLAYAALHEPISYLARPLDNPLIDDLTVALRTRFGNRPINKTNAAMAASKLLRHGGILGILADVNAHPKEGVFVPFFGVPACTSSGAAMLAIRTNSMIVPMCAVWDEAANRYRVLHGKILEPTQSGDRKRDVIDMTEKFTAEFEKFVRAYPEQWLWIHKRWKTRPPGELGLY